MIAGEVGSKTLHTSPPPPPHTHPHNTPHLDHAQRLVVAAAAAPDLVGAERLEECVHGQQQRGHVDRLVLLCCCGVFL